MLSLRSFLLHGSGAALCLFPWLWEPLTFEPKFDLDYILEQALRWHASTINIR